MLLGICGIERAILLNSDKDGMTETTRKEILIEHDAVDDALSALGLNSAGLGQKIREKLSRGSHAHPSKTVSRSPGVKTAFRRAVEDSPEGVANCLHLLSALLEEPGPFLTSLLGENGKNPAQLRDAIENRLRQELPLKQPTIQAGKGQAPSGGRSALERYGRDLTREAREGRLSPVIGRRKEILQVIQTLARASKNNPVLVGEAGVGKTAVVEALAQRIADGKDASLAGKRIIELNIGSLIAGTKYRGEFESRVTKILEEARKDPTLIVFIDELHTVIGAGSAEGSADAANLLKPALARGEIRCIGATTLAEFRRHVEQDPALERRFDKIMINEPSVEEALEMLRGVRPRWEAHHGIRIQDEALKAAVELSVRFDTDHQLPDKAVDLVDKAGARARIPTLSIMPGKEAPPPAPSEVTPETVAAVLSEKTSVPVEMILARLRGADSSRLPELAASLKTRLIGQDQAVELVCRRLNLAHAGLEKRPGPLAVFIFLGPTGSGKTQLAKSLAENLFGAEDDLIRLDMSEFMEEHSAAKLIGSPPGYVGHDEEGQLTGRLRTKPYSVILLDEVEKAHPRVMDLFLQVFDEGRLTDSKGRTADARNAIFIMTSNLGSAAMAEPEKAIGFVEAERPDAPRAETTEALKEHFRSELINRIDELVVFRHLEPADAATILQARLKTLAATLKKQHGVELTVTPEAAAFIAEAGFSRTFGVRELNRALARLLEEPLSALILEGRLKAKPRWKAEFKGGAVLLAPAS